MQQRWAIDGHWQFELKACCSCLAPIPGIPGLCPPQLNDRAGPQRTSRRHTYGAWHRCQPAGRLQRGLAGNDRGEWPSCGGQPPCAGGEPPCGGGEPSGSYRSRPCRRGRSAAGNSGAGGKGESVGGKGAQLDEALEAWCPVGRWPVMLICNLIAFSFFLQDSMCYSGCSLSFNCCRGYILSRVICLLMFSFSSGVQA